MFWRLVAGAWCANWLEETGEKDDFFGGERFSEEFRI
jgi:hypothetical protein